MRRHLFMLFCLLMVSSVSWADDCAKLGFKGKVKRVVYYRDRVSKTVADHYRGSSADSVMAATYKDKYTEPEQVSYTEFGPSGALNKLALPVMGYLGYYDFSNIQSTSTGYTAHGGSSILTLGKYGITKAVFETYDGYAYTNLYTYDQKGNLTKVNVTKSWEEDITVTIPGSAKRADYFYKKMSEAYLRRDMVAYWDNLNKATLAKKPSYTTKRVKKSSTSEVVYSYEKFDEVGNWIMRTSRYSGYNTSWREYAKWVYDEEFLAEFLWNRNVVPTMDVDSIESFYTFTLSPKYRKQAQSEWNNRIFGVVETKYNNSLDKYLDIVRKPIASAESRQKAHNYVGEQKFQTIVLPERDFTKVTQLADMHQDSILVFPEDYRRKILERAEALRQDSIKYLLNVANTSLSQKSYAKCSETARLLMNIEPTSQDAIEYAAESEYQLLQERAAAGTVAEEDYVSYLELNPGSKYTRDVQNARALYACSLFGKTTDFKEFMRVRALPMDYNIYKIVRRKSDHQSYLNDRGKFFHAGVTGFGSIDKGFYGYGGGVSMRFGWLLAWLNGFADVEVEHLDNMTKKSKLNGCVVKGNRLNVPFGLRLNVVRDPDFATFVSVGAQYSMPLGAKISGTLGEDAYKISDKNIFNKNNIIPRVGFGIATTHFELELYGLYETGKGVVNRSYVEGNAEYMNILDPVVVDKQFKSKIHGGLTFRLLFGK